MRRLSELYSNDPDRLLRFNHAKLYVDGIVSQATSALYEPYEEDVGLLEGEELGFLYFRPSVLNDYASRLEV